MVTSGWLLAGSDLHVRAIPRWAETRDTGLGKQEMDQEQRRGNRTKAVLPVRIKGKDSTGRSFDIMAHTLDVTSGGARLGSVRQELTALDEVTVLYRGRRMQFRVVWTKKLKGTSEFQVGLQALTQDKEGWGLSSQEQQGTLQQGMQLSASPASA